MPSPSSGLQRQQDPAGESWDGLRAGLPGHQRLHAGGRRGDFADRGSARLDLPGDGRRPKAAAPRSPPSQPLGGPGGCREAAARSADGRGGLGIQVPDLGSAGKG